MLVNHFSTILLFSWKMRNEKRKIISNAVSPLFLISYLIILLWGYAINLDYERKYYFTNEDRIEKITGVRLPDIDIVEYQQGKSRMMDYIDQLLVKFEKIPSEEVYQTLDSLIETGKTGWRMNDSAYMFSATWGNGLSAPKGESENEDRSFCIFFKKGSKRVTINSVTW